MVIGYVRSPKTNVSSTKVFWTVVAGMLMAAPADPADSRTGQKPPNSELPRYSHFAQSCCDHRERGDGGCWARG